LLVEGERPLLGHPHHQHVAEEVGPVLALQGIACLLACALARDYANVAWLHSPPPFVSSPPSGSPRAGPASAASGSPPRRLRTTGHRGSARRPYVWIRPSWWLV